MCFGSRAFWAHSPSDGEGDPLRHLADQYLRQSLCPRMYEEFDRRLQFIEDAVERAKVDGVVLVHNKFCDVHGIDNALLRLRLEERGVPVLSLEKEYGAVADRGRIRTRVQAFLERIGGTR
jgi:benzoyl-CoA reductase subunit C